MSLNIFQRIEAKIIRDQSEDPDDLGSVSTLALVTMILTGLFFLFVLG